jgi:hypothetical protein
VLCAGSMRSTWRVAARAAFWQGSEGVGCVHVLLRGVARSARQFLLARSAGTAILCRRHPCGVTLPL